MTKGVVCTIGQIKQSGRSGGKEIMSSQKVFANLVITWVGVLTLAILLGTAPVVAQSGAANYAFLVGSGFLCDSA